MSDPRLQYAELTAVGHDEEVVAALDGVDLVLRIAETREVDTDVVVGIAHTANLAARLFPHLTLDLPQTHADLGHLGRGPLRDVVTRLVDRLALPRTAIPARRVEVVWGGDAEPGGYSVDACGWSYSFGRRHVPISTGEGPPVGALAAGSLVVARLFVDALRPLGLAGLDSDEPVVSNLLTYENTVAPSTIALPVADLPAMTLAGAGSVGSSVLYAGLLAGARGGPVDLVDPDRFTDRNLLRYPVLAEVPDAEKVRWLAELARRAGIAAQAYATDIQGYLAEFDAPPTIDLAVVSVDTVEGRRDATDMLAATTLNIGVSGLALHIARHGFTGPEGCAYCQYVDVKPGLSGAEELANLLGLPVDRVVAIELHDGRLTESDAEALRSSGRFGDRPPRAGDRLADLRRRVYAQAKVETQQGDLLVSAPFVSAMAGVLALAETVKHGDPALEPFRLGGRYDIDLTGLPPGHITALQRDRSGRCLCYSGFRRRAFAALRSRSAQGFATGRQHVAQGGVSAGA
jgi:hypothetical protein